jgi:hypothetical protein
MPVISNAASRRFFFHVRSCERVGLRREKSLCRLLRDEKSLFSSVSRAACVGAQHAAPHLGSHPRVSSRSVARDLLCPAPCRGTIYAAEGLPPAGSRLSWRPVQTPSAPVTRRLHLRFVACRFCAASAILLCRFRIHVLVGLFRQEPAAWLRLLAGHS